jgi:hypothetical protein
MLARVLGSEKEEKKQAKNMLGEEATSATVHAAVAGMNRATNGAVGKYWIDAIATGIATIVAVASKPRSGQRAFARGIAKGNLHALISRLVYSGSMVAPIASNARPQKVAGEEDEEIRVKEVAEADY